MNIDEIMKTIKNVSKKNYPNEPLVSKLCEDLFRWERENVSFKMHRYKDAYLSFLNNIVNEMIKDKSL